MTKTGVIMTAVWLRRMGEHAEVLIEINGEWHTAIRERADAAVSHIAEATAAGGWPRESTAPP